MYANKIGTECTHGVNIEKCNNKNLMHGTRGKNNVCEPKKYIENAIT